MCGPRYNPTLHGSHLCVKIQYLFEEIKIAHADL